MDEIGARVVILDAGTAAALDRVAPGVFDGPVDPGWAGEFLADPRHHLAVGVHGDLVIGMASAVHYVHPDKAPELWINEVGVADSHRRRGVASSLIGALLDRARELGCTSAWVLTEQHNEAAHLLYRRAGGVRVDPDPVMFEIRVPGSNVNPDPDPVR